MRTPLIDHIRGLAARLSTRHRGDMDARLDDETRFHIEMATEQHVRAGVPRDEARRLANIAFGGRAKWGESARDEYRSRVVDELVYDIRYALRGLRRTPAFTGAALATLALSVGATTSMFSVVNAVLLRSLPYPSPDRIVVLCERNLSNGQPCNSLNSGNYLSWVDNNRSFEAMGAFNDPRITLSGGGLEPVSAQARAATASMFSILGARPSIGRLFNAEDDRDGAPNVMVLGYAFWQDHFGGDQSIVGKTLLIQSYEYTVIGVTEPGFGLYDPIDVWMPMRFRAANRTAPGRSYHGIARLKSGVTVADASRDLAAMAAHRAQDMPSVNANWTALTVPLRENLVGSSQRALWILLGAVGFLLIIACANVASLLLARAADREREVAVRISLGASPARIVRQLLTESLVLSMLSATLGFILAVKGTEVLVALVPRGLSIQNLATVSADWRVLLFTTAIAAVTGVLFGLAPARQAVRNDHHETLKEGGRGGSASSRAHGRVRNVLVVAEMSVALILLAGAGLMARSFAALQHVSLGFEPAHVMTASVALPRRQYASDTSLFAFFNAAEERLRALPGVTAVGAINYMPLTGLRSSNGFNVEGRPPAPSGQEPVGDMRAVTPGYFAAMGIPIAEGRGLTAADVAGTPAVGVVSETLARTMWPGESAIGHYLLYTWNGDERVQIVGVARDVHHDGADIAAYMEIYRPLAQFPFTGMSLVVRGRGDAATYAAAMRNAIHEVDPGVAVARLQTMDRLVAESFGRTRLSTALFGLFGVLGLILAAVGIYGVMSYTVQQRRHEIGVRMALGARPADVVGMVMRRGATLAAAGIAIGTVGALVLTRLMTKLLFGVSPNDGATFVAIAAALAGVGLLAAYVPGRRATKVDPVSVLRGD